MLDQNEPKLNSSPQQHQQLPLLSHGSAVL